MESHGLGFLISRVSNSQSRVGCLIGSAQVRYSVKAAREAGKRCSQMLQGKVGSASEECVSDAGGQENDQGLLLPVDLL